MEMCFHLLNHHIARRHHNGCSLSQLFFQANVITFLIPGAVYLLLAQIKCFCSKERGRKTGGEKKSLCGGFTWNLRNQLFFYCYFLILIQFSNTNLDSLLFTLIVLLIQPVRLIISHINSAQSLSRTALLCCSFHLEYG